SWLKAPADKQLDILTAMQSDAFFQKVRGQCITSLYDNQMAYKHFGYQGESWSKGGYIKRGFNDLTWLPDPPASASPPPFNS
ncbi:MAG: tat (twin-arginine translocation) pathway signal sequence, partial [Castellaniella sp.]